MTVSFTGHRNIKSDIDELMAKVYDEIYALYKKGADTFCCGGALGFDTVAALCVLRLRESCNDVKLKLILPCLPEFQTKEWKAKDRESFMQTMAQADSVEFLSDEYTKTCMKDRNQRLIDYADICVCYFNGSRSRSGTGQTVRMAESKGIKIINVY